MGDKTLIYRMEYLSDDELEEMVKAIMKIIKENKFHQTYEMRFGSAVDAGFD